MLNLLTLSHLVDEPALARSHRADAASCSAPRLEQMGRGRADDGGGAVDLSRRRSQVVIVGPRHDARELIAGSWPRSICRSASWCRSSRARAQAALARALPFIASMEMRDGRPTAYVCRDFTCGEPVTDAVRCSRAQIDGS